MVREHSLSDTDEGVAIFTTSAEKELRKLDSTQSYAALTAILNCLESPVPSSVIEKTYETCKELQQLRQGDLRIYCKLISNVPDYTVLWVFAVKKHQYRNLGKYDAQACKKTARLGSFTDREQVEEYIRANEALSVDRLKKLREEF